MNKHHLRFRQIHLDFHTSPDIPGIGSAFNKKEWQDTLKTGHVDSITIFAKCHHGLSYYPTKVGIPHPSLSCNLLDEQYKACKEINVNAPIYVSAGIDMAILEEHPEYRWVYPMDDKFSKQDYAPNGLVHVCFNGPYLDYLCEQIKEVVTLYPDCDGIFLDIISLKECVCPTCVKWMKEHSLNPRKHEDRMKCAEHVLEEYYRRTTEACKITNPNMPVFHNSGHVDKSDTRIIDTYFSHLELESLPTGGWGYDHFPISAKFAKYTGFDFLGMSGKFHTSWGEFGGYKTPEALKYECMQMLAFGSKCSIGDQLHPNGQLDDTTYRLIGEAYKEVEAKEAWCDNVQNIADICVLSQESESGVRDQDTGVGRVLLENGYLFDLTDRKADFNRYKLLILADTVRIDQELKDKIDVYLAQGGKLILSGDAGLWKDRDEFAFNIGAENIGMNKFQPDYIQPKGDMAIDFYTSPQVMYKQSRQVKLTDGTSLADIWDPYFNKTWEHFCSHQHAPYDRINGFPGIVLNKDKNILYFAHEIFELYGAFAEIVYKKICKKAIDLMLADPTVRTNLPSMGRVNLCKQEKENRYVLHLLYANKQLRGNLKDFNPEGENYVWLAQARLEVIEELMPIHNTEVEIKVPEKIKSITDEPTGQEIPFTEKDGAIKFTIPEFTCHIMPVLHY
ncbi:MAG: hypothetical protein KBT47_09105 [Armatimonadetes bacterium]|nr:hypothetical protein [Candidatus Hippobium faecium]